MQVSLFKRAWQNAKRDWLLSVLIVLLGLATAVALFNAWQRLSIEMMVPYYGDASVYFGAGRGLLNGLTPYTDLLEVKPPGIFLLTAFSLLFNGTFVIMALRFGVFIGIPILTGVYAYSVSRHTSVLIRIFNTLFAVLVGLQLMMHVVYRAGGFQTEAFGVFWAVLFCVLYAIEWRRHVLKQSLIALCIFCAVGLKEPFVLSLLASALILSTNVRDFIQDFLLPLLAASVVGIALLYVLGWLDPYLYTYLPVIFGDRLSGTEPLWQRGLVTKTMLQDLVTYNTVIPMAGYAVALLCVLYPAVSVQGKPQWKWLGLSILVSYLGLWLMQLTALFFKLKALAPLWVLFVHPAAAPLMRIYSGVFLVTVVGMCVLAMRKKELLYRTLILCVSVYLATVSAGVGNFLLQHFLFAIPLYIALAMVFIRFMQNAAAPTVFKRTSATLLTCLLFLTAFQDMSKENKVLKENMNTAFVERAQAVLNAERLDAIMDACNLDRYAVLKEGWIVGFTRHSPIDLSWTEVRSFGPKQNAAMRDRFFTNLERSSIAVIRDGAMWNDEELLTALNERFTESVPTCAQNLPAIDDLIVVYSKDLVLKGE